MGEIENGFMKYKRMKMCRRVLCFMLGFGSVVAFAAFYIYEWNRMPDVIYVESGEEQRIDLGVPAMGELYRESMETGAYPGTAVESISQESVLPRTVVIDFSKEIVLSGSGRNTYCADLKLLGVLPYKTVRIEPVDTYEVIPSGQTIGIYVKLEGIYVIDVGDFKSANGQTVSPCGNLLQSGDYIIKVNGEEVTRKKDFMELVHSCGGKALELTVLRNEETIDLMVVPEPAQDGSYKIGAWIRDSLQGVGTMTYMEADGDYAALGHGVRDVDTNELVNISSGALYETSIVSIHKGEEGEPGSVTGLIQY